MLNKKQINTHRYGDYTITDNYSCHYSPFKRASDMIVISGHIFQIQHQQMTKLGIPLC